jgi:hypothetical protein
MATAMGIRRVEDLTSYQFVLELKLEAYRLINQCPEARQDKKFAGQLRDALADCEADVAEGFARKKSGGLRELPSFQPGVARGIEDPAQGRRREGVLH